MENCAHPRPDEVLPRVMRLIQDGIAAGHQLGGQLYVSRAGQLLVDTALGDAAPGLAMRPDMLLPWLSSVKPVMAVAVAQQSAAGRLGYQRSSVLSATLA